MELLQDAGTQLELETKTTHMIQGWESAANVNFLPKICVHWWEFI